MLPSPCSLIWSLRNCIVLYYLLSEKACKGYSKVQTKFQRPMKDMTDAQRWWARQGYGYIFVTKKVGTVKTWQYILLIHTRAKAKVRLTASYCILRVFTKTRVGGFISNKAPGFMKHCLPPQYCVSGYWLPEALQRVHWDQVPDGVRHQQRGEVLDHLQETGS